MRRHHQGVLRIDDEDDVINVRFVLQPSTGQPVLPVPPRTIGQQCVLCLPDDALDNADCLQLIGGLEEVNPQREAACDRWNASFGKSSVATWCVLRVQTAKQLDQAFDGALVSLANPLAKEEGALCKACNAHQANLTRACEKQLHVKGATPFAVGVDALGVDVRLTFGLARLEFGLPVACSSEAMQEILRW
jgi:hypothetical protein